VYVHYQESSRVRAAKGNHRFEIGDDMGESKGRKVKRGLGEVNSPSR